MEQEFTPEMVREGAKRMVYEGATAPIKGMGNDQHGWYGRLSRQEDEIDYCLRTYETELTEKEKANLNDTKKCIRSILEKLDSGEL